MTSEPRKLPDGIRVITLKGGGKHYKARVEGERDAEGKRTEVTQNFVKLSDAVAWRRAQLVSKDRGTFLKPSDQRLGAYLREWLDGPEMDRVRMGTLRMRSWSDNDKTVRRLVLPCAIAQVPLSKLTTDALETHYLTLFEKGSPRKTDSAHDSKKPRPLGVRSVRGVHVTISGALEGARKRKLIATNPARGAKLPKKRPAPNGTVTVDDEDDVMRVLSRAQLNHLLATAARPPAEVRKPTSKHDSYRSPLAHDRWLALWHVLATGGLRPSEALGLVRDDVKLTGVRIRRSLTTGLKGIKWRLDPPKNKRSARFVSLPAASMAVLRTHLNEQKTEHTAKGYIDNGFVFALTNGSPLSLRMVRRRFRTLLKSAELPQIRLYDLRHTHITLFLDAGVKVHRVAKRAGHSPAVTHATYCHVTDEGEADALAQFEAHYAAIDSAKAQPTLTLVAESAA
ncbi:MAG TPA: site-specific integrase [Gemmatimonadaceae bacterium]|nr:site-specific integrase [Gemmatimonadaceae bacterium]